MVGMARICCCLLTVGNLPTEAPAFWALLEAIDLVTALTPRVVRLVTRLMMSANTETRAGSSASWARVNKPRCCGRWKSTKLEGAMTGNTVFAFLNDAIYCIARRVGA